jgi:threonine synthase
MYSYAMNSLDFPADLRESVRPSYRGDVVYSCVGCGAVHGVESFLYTCPACGSLLSLVDRSFETLAARGGDFWRRLFRHRALADEPASLKGIFRFHECVLPFIDPAEVIWLGEGHTPLVPANDDLARAVGAPFQVKNDGLNPSASFKDRGMASAISYLNHAIRHWGAKDILGICASTGDTSAAAALYLSYLPKGVVKPVVLLPAGKVTPQQLSQPLGSGATVIEVPGVFDDCMRIVEELARDYQVFLLNSKNPVRISGQKSFAYEVVLGTGAKASDLAVVVPIGNAGNVTAIMEGFLDFLRLGIIDSLPLVVGVQSVHADPVFRWRRSGIWQPVAVRPSVAQAAMIGNPVSFPKVRKLVEEHFRERFAVVEVTEQDIIENMLTANRHGHVVCTQGGEAIAGLRRALAEKIVDPGMTLVVDSTSHQLKFSGFQQHYFEDTFPADYEITPRAALRNMPVRLEAKAADIAGYLDLKPRS